MSNSGAARVVIGVMLIVMGGVWLLQGLNQFPGDGFMNGQLEWAIIGTIVALAGAYLVLMGARGRRA